MTENWVRDINSIKRQRTKKKKFEVIVNLFRGINSINSRQSIQFNSIHFDQNFESIQFNSIQPNWIELNWFQIFVELNWIELNWLPWIDWIDSPQSIHNQFNLIFSKDLKIPFPLHISYFYLHIWTKIAYIYFIF